MSVTIRRNFGRLAQEIPLSNRTLMRELGLLAREQIIRRTKSGTDQAGKAFAPYSASYRATKARELGKGGTVDLTVSGDMLNAITILRITDNTVTLGFKR